MSRFDLNHDEATMKPQSCMSIPNFSHLGQLCDKSTDIPMMNLNDILMSSYHLSRSERVASSPASKSASAFSSRNRRLDFSPPCAPPEDVRSPSDPGTPRRAGLQRKSLTSSVHRDTHRSSLPLSTVNAQWNLQSSNQNDQAKQQRRQQVDESMAVALRIKAALVLMQDNSTSLPSPKVIRVAASAVSSSCPSASHDAMKKNALRGTKLSFQGQSCPKLQIPPSCRSSPVKRLAKVGRSKSVGDKGGVGFSTPLETIDESKESDTVNSLRPRRSKRRSVA